MSDEEQRELLGRPDVIAAADSGRFLAARGLTPNAFQLASEAVATLVDDLRAGGELEFSANRPLRLRRDPRRAGAPSPRGNELWFREVATDVAHIADLDLGAAAEAGAANERAYGHVHEIPLPRSSAVLGWLMDVSVCKPQVFRDLEALPVEGGGDVLLRPTVSPRSLAERWAVPAESLAHC